MDQDHEDPQSSSPEPRGFSEHSRRTSSENAHEQGWGLNEDERRQIPPEQQHQGGTDYEYGARDFGDSPADTSQAQPKAGAKTLRPQPESQNAQPESQNVGGDADRKQPTRRKKA